MKSLYKITFLICITILVSSCHNNSRPNYQYMPNMYEPVSYETYEESSAFKNGKEGQLPPAGTINRGFEPYDLKKMLKSQKSCMIFIALFVMEPKVMVKVNW